MKYIDRDNHVYVDIMNKTIYREKRTEKEYIDTSPPMN